MTTDCTAINATTAHFAVRPGDVLPCGHAARRGADSSLVCGERLSRTFAEIAEGEVIYTHGVPFVITQAAKSTPEHAVQSVPVTWMVGTYQGEDLGSYAEGNNLAPFVRRAGDTWTFQGAIAFARVYSYDGGQTWSYSI